MFGDMMGKLQEMKQKMEESKKRLEGISVKGFSPDKNISIEINGNRKVKAVKINPEFLKTADSEEIEDMLIIAMNQALEQAEKVNESEMSSTARGILPNMPF